MATKSKLKSEGADDNAVKALLSDTYQKYGSQKKVADALKVSPSTVSTWLARLGLREHTIVVERDQDKPQTAA
jgi:DNA invertase Pin-like site-specific DNA recombinase